MQSVHDYKKLKTKLENRRLDYDAKLNKAQKAKAQTPSLEEDVRVAQTKYEETLQDISATMIALNANEEDQLTELCRFVDAEVEFFERGLERLKALQREFAALPRMRSATNTRAEYKRNISSNSVYDGGYRDSSISQTPAFTPPMGSISSIARRTSGYGGGSFGSGGSGNAPPPLPSREPIPTPARPNQKQTKALYQFDAEGPGELSIRKGDIINVVEEVDEGWWIGEMADGSGRHGMFPANYCEVVESQPLQRPAPPVPSSAAVSPRLVPSAPSLSYGGGITSSVQQRSFASTGSRGSVILPSRPSYADELASNGGGGYGSAAPPCSVSGCGCTEFVENAFKPGQCRSCFHK
ncbi:Endophilin-A2 [Entophlyctis sp. JEL0112]|nr:Endophilin-A2 [Entophlyctis sp. JEL0112]